MSFKLSVIAFTISAFINLSLNAHFFFLEKWTLDNQTIYCFADYHISRLESNKVYRKQQDQIIELAKKLNAHAIVEDDFVFHENLLSDPVNFELNDYIMPVSSLQIFNDAQPPLTGLASLFGINKIPRINVEYRLAMHVSLLNIGYNDFSPISTIAVFSIIENTLEWIKSFNHGSPFNEYFNERIEIVTQVLKKGEKFFDLFRNSQKSIGQLLKEQEFLIMATQKMIDCNLHWNLHSKDYYLNNPSKVKELFENPLPSIEIILKMFDAELIDCSIAHALHCQKNRESIIMCAGSEHIKAIRPLLKNLGYTQTTLAGNQYESYFENANELMTTEPDAISDLINPIVQK